MPEPSLPQITSTATSAPLSPQQKKFNTQVERIARQRALLADWEVATGAFRTRYAAEYQPLLAAHQTLMRELVQWLDAEASPRKLSKADRATLGEAIAELAASLFETARDEATRTAMKALYDRYADTRLEEEEAVVQEMARTLAQEMFGVDLDGVDMDSPEAMARRIEEQVRERQAQAERAREAHQAQRRARKPSAKERKAQEEAQQASQSVREIYRKLASTLHPDREPDPAERARKTALMQRVNQAYQDNKLLDLLQLQLEAEQIDPAHIAGLGEERLKSYNRVLADQLAELTREVQATQASFCHEFGLAPHYHRKPEQLGKSLRLLLLGIAEDSADLRAQLRTLQQDPAELKHWLREQRAAFKAQEEELSFW